MNNRRYLRLGAVAVALAMMLGGLVTAPAPASAAPNCAQPGVASPQVTWAQRALALDLTDALSTGGNQRIAVLSTGVDAQQPQLRGRVEAGTSVVPAAPGVANTDCAGLGTQVGGVVAAGKLADAGFAGVAPSARIVPVRVVDSQKGEVTPAVLAAGIQAAVAAKVTVICVPLAVYATSDALDAAVQAALSAGIPVVAAAGDAGSDSNPKPYPASLKGVIAVTAMDVLGQVLPGSGFGDYVTLGGPGAGVDTLQTGSGLVGVGGTGVAAGFVAGSVALVRSRHPELPPAGIAKQLAATATSVQRYPLDDALAGMVNPYRALTEALVSGSPDPVPGYRAPPPAATDAAQAWARDLALQIAGAALLVTTFVTLIALAAPRGRRRSWRSTVVRRPAHEPDPAEPSPPVLLFEERA